jgi:hypothetical protein
MHAAGYPAARIAKLVMRSVETVSLVVATQRQEARELNAERVHGYMLRAAEVAAEQGDHRPALEWLDRYGAIPETSKQRTMLERARIGAAAMRDQSRHLTRGAGALPQAGPVINIGIVGSNDLSMQAALASGVQKVNLLSGHADSQTDDVAHAIQVNELEPMTLPSRAKGPQDDRLEALAEPLADQPGESSVRLRRAQSDRGPSRRAK